MMNKFLISAAALALCVGTASAQDQKTTTTTVDTPSASTTTQTTVSNDGYATYRKTVTSTKRYDAAAFAAPSGYTYRRFSVGQHVPDMLLGDSVVLGNYSEYALVSPPTGFAWIATGTTPC